MEWFMQALLVRAVSALFIWHLSRSNLCTAAPPLLHPVELEETCNHTHVHDLCSHGRCVSISVLILWCIWTDAVHH